MVDLDRKCGLRGCFRGLSRSFLFSCSNAGVGVGELDVASFLFDPVNVGGLEKRVLDMTWTLYTSPKSERYTTRMAAKCNCNL